MNACRTATNTSNATRMIGSGAEHRERDLLAHEINAHLHQRLELARHDARPAEREEEEQQVDEDRSGDQRGDEVEAEVDRTEVEADVAVEDEVLRRRRMELRGQKAGDHRPDSRKYQRSACIRPPTS